MMFRFGLRSSELLLMINIIKQSDANFSDVFAKLLCAKREMSVDVDTTVKAIIDDVRENGDKALFAYTAKFDNLELDSQSVRISQEMIQDAIEKCDAEVLNAFKISAKRIEEFHSKTLPIDLSYTDNIGVKLGMRYTPVESAGLYVPGGTASYPSSVLMNAIPARVAGVERLVMVVPTPNGDINPYVLAAADICGVTEIYRVGGAQAIASLAFGTESIAPVVKITGPGNAYVATAKRQVFGHVGIDMIAGPSEILVVADKNANPEWVAMDLLSQAEHDVSAQSILITPCETLATQVVKSVEKILETLPRTVIATKSWQDFGAVIVVDAMDDSIDLVNAIAPEHLELAMENAQHYAESIKNAGAIFLGYFTPEAIGDYIGGPNHVLPTARSARFASGLGVVDFMKRTTILGCNADNLQKIGHQAICMSTEEGLHAHGMSVSLRLGKNNAK